jgi:predicted amino acid racemase
MERWMIRTPAISEATQVVADAELSLNSDLAVLKALDRAALEAGKLHKVILMADLGDLREGFFDREELLRTAGAVREDMKGLSLAGVGVNLTCFSFVQSDTEKMLRLLALSRELGLPSPVVSGGNSAALDLMLRGGFPEGVNNLRLGESLLFGRERARYRYLEGTENDAFLLRAEIVECREKPSMPVGTIGSDSYGRTPVFSDRGIRKRAICAVGRQSVDSETMWPADPGVEILGASSDHLVLDVTDSEKDYRTGDLVAFRLGYFSTMRAFTSPYVEKRYLPDD